MPLADRPLRRRRHRVAGGGGRDRAVIDTVARGIHAVAMRSRGLRLVSAGWAVGAAMVAFAWLLPTDDTALSTRARLLFLFLAVAALLASLYAALRAAAAPADHPRAFAIRDGRFQVRTGAALGYTTAVQPVLFALLLIAELPRLREPAPPGIDRGWYVAVLTGLPVLLAAYATLPYMWREWSGEPALAISSAGVRVRLKINQWREIPWTALATERPTVLSGQMLVLRADHPDQVRSGGLFLGRRRRFTTLPVRQRLHVDPEFLAGSIDYYVRNPAERAGIGTPDGHARLVAGLGPA